MNQYNSKFYANRHKNTAHAAKIILSIVQDIAPDIHSAVDIGCGVGTWLRVLKDRGISDIRGFDGEWVNKENLVIPTINFTAQNLTNILPKIREYDLVISLEVAEHLPSDYASEFIAQLTNLGKIILFSAAIPGQGGIGHVNEQWPTYWINLFEEYNYVVLDVIRDKIWNDNNIAVHYRQNILLFVSKDIFYKLKIKSSKGNIPTSIVHPQLLINISNDSNVTIKQSIKRLISDCEIVASAIKRYVYRKINHY